MGTLKIKQIIWLMVTHLALTLIFSFGFLYIMNAFLSCPRKIDIFYSNC
ncbi:hypothetical protein M6B38_109855 [Iris pallida]|uniref:Uncharacterized protein n=1 Tax=Iris pallida TaxID=29817 RepID=A0AAX6E8J3_IRIPA|nr:hypothetical protein M6B38_109850 [Iris pallida]KAJ6800359.1 hypothetical protein M6B38_109855 [Iris pallida]